MPPTRIGLLVASLLVFAAPAFAQLPNIIDNAITRKVEDKVEDTVNQKVEQTVNQAVSNKVAQSVQSKVESTVETAVDNKLTRGVADALEKTTEPVIGVVDRLAPSVNVTPPLRPFREVQVEDAWRAIDHEWIALLPPERAAALNIPSIRILSRTNLAASGLVMFRVQVSDADDNAGRAQQVLRSLGATAADRNHVYTPQAELPPDPAPAPAPQAMSRTAQARIGLIDTAVNAKHSALKKADVTSRDFVETKGARPTAHGTAIAALLVGQEKGHEGLLPRGKLYSASAFYQGDSGATGATTSSLIASLDWLASQHVGVVNMSLAGPPNEALRAFIDQMIARGMIIVAAVGNDGPTSRPLYPAAYEPVVAVTAVDQSKQIYRWANQGPQVDLAAWGVKSTVANDKGGYEEESGTSFAAPVVAALLAAKIAEGRASREAINAIIASAEDLGPRGRDNTFGYGLVRAQ